MIDDTEKQSLLDAFDLANRRNSRYVGRTMEKLERVTRVTGPSSESIDNVVIWSQLTEQNADDEIAEHIAYFAELGHDFEWIYYEHDQPPDLKQRLLGNGFLPESEEDVVIAPAIEISQDPSHPVGVRIERIESSDDIPLVIEVQNEVWGKKHQDFISRWLTAMITDTPEDTIILVAMDGTKPVAAAWASLKGDRPFAPFFGGSVLPNWRGRGIYRALVVQRARAAAGKGIEWCLVDAGPASLPILRKLGFAPLTRRIRLLKNA